MRLESIKNNVKFSALFAFILVFTGCAANRDLAAFFFDGVPGYQQNAGSKVSNGNGNLSEKNSSGKAVKAVAKKKQPKKIKSIHKPFKEKKCDKCHDKNRKTFLVVPKDKLCFQCHDRKKFFNKFVHGPVAPGRCSACHLPHNSTNPYLLRYVNEELCYQCHDPMDIKKIKDHQDRADCLKCHDPHTQDNKYFLKPEVKEKFNVI